MATLNIGAANAALSCGVAAATDVTGFGLCGHGAEMAAASGVTLEIHSEALPLLPGAAQLAAQEIVSGGAKRNQQHLGSRLEVASDVANSRLSLALDSETSGGLLLAISSDKVEDLQNSLKAEGVQIQAIIGEVKPAEGNLRIRILR